jgi:hypothetical protein
MNTLTYLMLHQMFITQQVVVSLNSGGNMNQEMSTEDTTCNVQENTVRICTSR